MSTRKVFGTRLQDGETFKYTFVVKDEAGTAINMVLNTAVTSLTLDYYNKATGATINSRSGQNVLGSPSMGVYPGAGNHTLASNGTVVWKSGVADSNFVTNTNVTVVARYTYVFPDAATVARTGIHEIEFTIEALTALS